MLGHTLRYIALVIDDFLVDAIHRAMFLFVNDKWEPCRMRDDPEGYLHHYRP